jgi:hypothetical protein
MPKSPYIYAEANQLVYGERVSRDRAEFVE